MHVFKTTTENVVEVPYDYDVTKRKAATCPRGPQAYRRQKALLLIFHSKKLPTSPCNVLHRQEGDFLQSSKETGFQNGAGLMTVATQPYGNVDAVTV